MAEGVAGVDAGLAGVGVGAVWGGLLVRGVVGVACNKIEKQFDVYV